MDVQRELRLARIIDRVVYFLGLAIVVASAWWMMHWIITGKP